MNKIILLVSIIAFFSCQPEKKVKKTDFKVNDPAVLHGSIKKLTDVIVYDIFTPPVASRIYAYSSLAAYEAIRNQKPEQFTSIAEKLNGFEHLPKPEAGKSYQFDLAALKAFMTVAQKVTFSVDSLKVYEARLLEQYAAVLDKNTYANSISFGEAIGKGILTRAAKDNYKETRGFARYSVLKGEDKWQPTAPDYMDAVEPFWHTITSFSMDSVSQCRPAPPMPFSTQKNSPFYKEYIQVYEIGKQLTDEQKEIARFWDDNPFVSHHTGHATFASKKMTPAGHWMAIATMAARQANADLIKTAQTYALTSVALFDGFISCWEEKYRSQLVRPITIINKQVDEKWEPFLQTPPFPEYSSGHGVISSAAATVLTHLYGNNFAYTDTTELEYGMGKRSFPSFIEAAKEAAISRLYGGIHYYYTCINSTDQGILVGNNVLKKTGLLINEKSEVIQLSTSIAN